MKSPIVTLAFAACALAGCSRPGSNENAFSWTNQLPAGSVLHFRDGTGDVTVRAATGQSVLVRGSSHWRRGRPADIHFAVTHTGNDYFICAMWRGSGGRCAANGYRGSQFGGLLTMFSLFHRGTDAAADFEAEVPASVVVDVTTSNGSVTVDGITAGVTATTRNGTVEAEKVAGPLKLATINGNVKLTADSLAPTDPIHLTTTNGVIHAELPANVQGSFDLSVANGMVHSDFPLASASSRRPDRHLQGQIGGSNRVVKMRAINGSVSLISRAGASGH